MPALGYDDVTADVATGLVVLHDRVTLQVLAPAAMLHEDDASVRVPDMGGAATSPVLATHPSTPASQFTFHHVYDVPLSERGVGPPITVPRFPLACVPRTVPAAVDRTFTTPFDCTRSFTAIPNTAPHHVSERSRTKPATAALLSERGHALGSLPKKTRKL